MSTDTKWTLARVAVGQSRGGWNVREGTDLGEFGPTGIGEWTDFVVVVPESRLREAEAERDLMERANETSMELADDFAGDVERLEAELREARQALSGVVAVENIDPNHDFTPVEATEEWKAAFDRARGVLT